MADDTLTLRIESEDDSEELTIPTALVDMLAEEGEGAPVVVADVALFGLAQRAHTAVHHAEGEPDEELETAEAVALDLFEERFGVTYGEATGHSH